MNAVNTIRVACIGHGFKNMLRLLQGKDIPAADLLVNPTRPRTAAVH